MIVKLHFKSFNGDMIRQLYIVIFKIQLYIVIFIDSLYLS